VWQLSSDPTVDYVEAQQPADCATADFSFPADAASPAGGTSSGASSQAAVGAPVPPAVETPSATSSR